MIVVFYRLGELLVAIYGNANFRGRNRPPDSGLRPVARSVESDPRARPVGDESRPDRVPDRHRELAGECGGWIRVDQPLRPDRGCVHALAASIVNTSQHYWYFSRNVDRLHLGREIIKIAPAALAAVACLAFSPGNQYASLLAALLVYACLAFLPLDYLSWKSQVSPDSVD